MQIKSRLFRFITILFLAVCGVLSLVVLELLGSKPEKKPLPVPGDAQWVIRVDALSILKEEVYTVLFESRDENLVRSIQKILDERRENTTGNPPLAIDFQNELVVYGIQKGTHHFTGIVLHLKNAEVFRENIPAYLTNGQTVAVHGNTALVISQLNAPPLPKKERQLLTENWLRKGVSTSRQYKPSPEWISIRSQFPDNDVRNLEIGILFGKHDLNLQGHLSYSQKEIKSPSYTLKSNGLFISTSIIPKGLADSVNKWLPIGSYHFPELQAMAVDYSGLIVENTSQGFKVLPKMNAVFEGKVPVSVTGIRASIPSEYLGPNNSIVFSSLTYYMKQLDKNTIFIGLDTTTILKNRQSSLVTIKGPLQPLADIKGNKMILSFMEILIPQLNPGKDFIRKTEYVDLSVVPGKKDRYIVKGKLHFKSDAFVLNEITRLVIGLNSKP